MSNKALLALQLLPAIVQAVAMLEQLFPGKGTGSVKKSIVLDTVQQAAEVTQDVVPIISATIDSVVDTLNANDAWPEAVGVLENVQTAALTAGAVAGAMAPAKPKRKRR